jgi:polyhydroxyalkanoate synthesis regulator phasin
MSGMRGRTKLKILGAGLAVAVVAGGGAALAATKPWSPHAESQAVINDAAKQLGVTPAELSDALKKALENRVDEAVSAGLLTKAQGDELKKRIESSDVPFPFGPGLRFGLGLGEKPFGLGHREPFDKLSAAASYLGLSESALASQLAQGNTLAQIAKQQGKSVDGLVSAMVKAADDKIDAAVKAGDLTKAQADKLKADLKERITELVNGDLPHDHAFRFRAPGFRFGFGFRGHLLPVKPSSADEFWAPRGSSA